jgi:hypothetical protein
MRRKTASFPFVIATLFASLPTAVARQALAPTDAASGENSKAVRLREKIVALAAAPQVDVATIARILECNVGPRKVNGDGDTVSAIEPTDLIVGGTIRYGWKDSIFPEVVLAADAGLTLSDLEPLFMDRPYEVSVINAESQGIPLKQVLSIDHMFSAPSGRLTFSVAPAAADGTSADDRIQKIAFMGSGWGAREDWPTLRQRRMRERAEAAEAAAYARLSPVQRARLDRRRKTRLARQIVQIASLPRLERTKVAQILGAKLGPATPHASNTRVIESPLGETELVAKGEISSFRDRVDVTFVPARRVGLTFSDLESVLLDYPHHQTAAWAHVGSGLASKMTSVRHVFDTKNGDLVIDVRPAEEAEGGPPDLVQRIFVVNERNTWTLEKTTLRAERAREKARGGAATPPRPPR